MHGGAPPPLEMRFYMAKHTHGNDDHSSAHTHSHSHGNHSVKEHILSKAKNAPGLIYIERQIHDDAIVISGSLSIRFSTQDPNSLISEELEAAAREIKERSGIVGHIKVSVSTTSTCMISVTDEKAMAKDSPVRRARMTLAAIVFLIDPKDAESIIRKALSNIRTRFKK